MDPLARLISHRRASQGRRSAAALALNIPVVVGCLAVLVAIAALAGSGDVLSFGFLPIGLGTALQLKELDSLRTVDDLTSFQKEVRERITELDAEKAGLPFNETEREEFSKLKEADGEISRRVTELEARRKIVADLSERSNSTERENEDLYRQPEARGSVRERDIYDLATVRVDLGNPERTREQLHSRAKRAIEISRFPITEDRDNARIYGFTNDQARAHVERLLDKDDEQGSFGRYLLATGDPAYRRAWTKAMNAAQRGVQVMSLTGEEQRAMQRAMAAERALGLGSTGIPIPFQLDPTVVPTSNSVVNPWRAICRTEQVVVNQWRGVTSGAITAAYAAEATEASDNTPTLAQPSIDAVRAQAFVPFSIEADQDWAALQSEMAVLIADAKDDLESNKFFSGGGTNEPFGLNAMSAGADVATAGVGAFVIGDTFKLEEGVPPRARPRSTIVGNRTILNKVRQFDTAGGAGLWLYWPQGLANKPSSDRGDGNTGAAGLGYPTYESSQMSNAVATGNRILLMGNFKYYLIVDRVGMSIEIIPHLFGAANRFPTGQRGLYAFWRNGGKTLSEAMFRFLKVA